MGNSADKQCGNYASIYNDYELIQVLGEGRRLLLSKTKGQRVISLQHTFASEDILKDHMFRNQSLHAAKHQYYLGMLHSDIVSVSNLCGRHFKMTEYYPYVERNLLQEIQERQQNEGQFGSEQVMSILCSCVLAMSHLCKQQILHYALSPQDILIDKDGTIKITHSCLSKHKFDFNYHPNFYYAPQTLKLLANPGLPNCLTHKSAVFTLALTILHALTLNPLQYLYNQQTFSIDMKEISQLLRLVQDRDLSSILKKMLKLHTYQRITFPQLQEMIFELIARKQSGQESEQVWTDPSDPISKLTNSISKIKHGEESQLSDCSSFQPFFSNRQQPVYYKHSQIPSVIDIQQQHRTNCISAILQSDREDMPQNSSQHVCLSKIDPLVLDQFETPLGRQAEQYTNRDDFQPWGYGQVLKDKNFETNNTSRQKHDGIKSERSSSVHIRNPPDYINFNSTYHHIDNKENSMLNYTNSQKQSHSKEPLVEQTDSYRKSHFKEYVVEQTSQGRYQGYKLAGERHGFGSFYYQQGGKYCGEWVQGRMQGRGVLYYSSGKIAYEGEWLEDRLHGYGVVYNDNIIILKGQFDYQHLQMITKEWTKYEGYFQEDKKHGQGTLHLSNGQTYVGAFENDQPHGLGQFRNVRGEVLRGYWLMGALNLT